MNRNLIAALGFGALLAGLVGYVASRPSSPPPPKEIVVAQVEEPKKETLPGAGDPTAGDPASDPKPAVKPAPVTKPVIEEPHRYPTTVYPPAPGEKPSPRRARANEVDPRSAASTTAKRQESPRVEATPAAVILPFPTPSPEPKAVEPVPVLPPPPPAPKKREPQTVSIKEGTTITIRTSELISSERQQPGDNFTAALAEPIVVDGFVLAERGSRVSGRVVESVAAGKVKGVARLTLELTQVTLMDGQKLQLATDPFVREGATSRKNDAAKIGAGAAIGAALGGIFGGGKGAAIGGAAGAGAGGGAVILTRGKPVEIESEARLPFRVNRPLTVIEKL